MSRLVTPTYPRHTKSPRSKQPEPCKWSCRLPICAPPLPDAFTVNAIVVLWLSEPEVSARSLWPRQWWLLRSG